MRLCVVVLGIACVACARTPDITINNYSNQQQSTGMPSPSPSASGAPGICLPVRTVEVAETPPTIGVGDQIILDATPLDAAGHGRDAQCDEADGILWTHSGPCTFDDDTSFNPLVTGAQPGVCGIVAIVGGKASRLVRIQVVQ